MSAICRTCMVVMTSGSQYFDIDEKDEQPQARASARLIKTKLEACVPELTLNIVKNSVICTDCVDALCTAYKFKIKCLEIEEIIYDYILQTESNSDSLDIATVVNWSGKFELYKQPESELPTPLTPNGKNTDKPKPPTRKVDLAEHNNPEASQSRPRSQIINLEDDEPASNYNLETLNRIIENSDTTVNCLPETLNKLIQNTDASADSNFRIFNKIIEDALADYKRRISARKPGVVALEVEPQAGCSSWEGANTSSAPLKSKILVELPSDAVVDVQLRCSGVNDQRNKAEKDIELVSVTSANRTAPQFRKVVQSKFRKITLPKSRKATSLPATVISKNKVAGGSSSSRKATDEGDVEFVSETIRCKSASLGDDVEFVSETTASAPKSSQLVARQPVIHIVRKANKTKSVATKTATGPPPGPSTMASQGVGGRLVSRGRTLPTDEVEIISVTKADSVDLTGGRARPSPPQGAIKEKPVIITIAQQKEAATMTDFSRPPRKFKQPENNAALATTIVTDFEQNIPASALQKIPVSPDFAVVSVTDPNRQKNSADAANPMQVSIGMIRNVPIVVRMVGGDNLLDGKGNAPYLTNGTSTSLVNDPGTQTPPNQVLPSIVSGQPMFKDDGIVQAKQLRKSAQIELTSETRPQSTPSMVIPVIQNVISEFQEEPTTSPATKDSEAEPPTPPTPQQIIDLSDDTQDDLIPTRLPLTGISHRPFKLEEPPNERPPAAPPVQERSSTRLRHKPKVTYGRFSYLKAEEREKSAREPAPPPTDTSTLNLKREPVENRLFDEGCFKFDSLEAADLETDGFRGFTPAEIAWSAACISEIKVENHELPDDYKGSVQGSLLDWLKREAPSKTEIISGLSCNYSQFCEFESQYEGFTMEKLYTEQLVALPECSVALTPLSDAELEKWRRTRSFKCRRCAFTCDSMVSMKMHRKAARQDGCKCGGGDKFKRHVPQQRRPKDPPKESEAEEDRAQENREKKNRAKKNRIKRNRIKRIRAKANPVTKNRVKKSPTKKMLSKLVRQVRLYKCNLCSYNSIYESSLLFHMDIHGEQPMVKAGKATHNIYTCKLCEFSTIYKSSLKMHFRVHVGKTLYKCRHCYFHSFNKMLYKQHKKSHLGSWYECIECVFSSQFKKNLQHHYINCHFQYEPFECKLCRMEFPEQFLLVKHVFTHDFRKQQVYLEHNYSDVSKVFTQY